MQNWDMEHVTHIALPADIPNPLEFRIEEVEIYASKTFWVRRFIVLESTGRAIDIQFLTADEAILFVTDFYKDLSAN